MEVTPACPYDRAMIRHCASVGALALALLLAAGVQAQTQEEQAAQTFEEATRALDSGDHARAAELYHRSYELYPAPTSAFWEAQALAKQHKLVAAAERYRIAAEWKLEPGAPQAFEQASADAKKALPALEATIPVIHVTVSGGGEPQLFIDDAPVPAPVAGEHHVDPGSHLVRATTPGRPPFEQRVAVSEGTSIDVVVAFAGPAGTEPPVQPPLGGGDEETADGSGQRIAGAIVVGLGGAGLLVWAITGGVYLAKQSTVEDECEDPDGDGSFVCATNDGVDAAADGKTIGVVNTVALFAGLGLVAVGVTVILTAPDGETESAVALRTRGAGLYLEGDF
jgi:hypothetical protein